MNVCVVGAAGAFGIKHLDAISCIEGAVVTSIVGTNTCLLYTSDAADE